MQSPGRPPAVQGRGAQAAALADALASLHGTPARMASLSAYGNGGRGGGLGRVRPRGSAVTPGNFGVRLRKAGEGAGDQCSARLEAAWKLGKGVFIRRVCGVEMPKI